ncbi:MAG: sigma-70 family RNA polymerase sigma factor [Candidatus Eisenbacteria bacterium]|uniref:Sigma-70 family RNA polymerase sigma factor n=1 Tax=Eiseniibacteriota bacterium TaxID=2212470 RepID=A0A849SIT4_UNCEI|nr:sigma-70 family RNA polymerase sigma factor [Candidatus Eisenbacteria bacterium]
MNERGGGHATDEQLVLTYQEDSHGLRGRAAAEELFARYGDRVYGWCFRMVRDHERALDLAQDSMLLACRALPGFRAEARFSSWLFAIVRHRCLRALRRPSLVRDESLDPDVLPEPSASVEETFERDQERIHVLQLVDEVLTPEERRALLLRCEEGLPVDEISRRLGLSSASGARGLLQTARRKLRAALARGRGAEGVEA